MIELPSLKISKLYNIQDVECKSGGIYFIYGEERNLLYIGKSSNISNRIKQHMNGYSEIDYSVKDMYKYVEYTKLKCPVDREIYETYYINKLSPPLNRSKVYLYKSQYYKYAKKEERFISQNDINLASASINFMRT